MSVFLSTDNLKRRTVTANSEPWEFKITAEIPPEVRTSKLARQTWYRDANTKHNFYSGIEGANPHQRVTKTDNPPRFVRAIAADYDLPLSQSQVKQGVADMPIKPAWTETSLGGNARLIWLLPHPVLVDGTEFCAFFLGACSKWLNMDALPGLDTGALTDPSRMLCNGGVWEATGAIGITECQLQAFFVNVGQEYRSKDTEGLAIPLDAIEQALKIKFPNFSWPGGFTLESQGPSFWIPGSTSARSAIVKPDGMFTFSGHANKPFYTWGDILGVDFVSRYNGDAIAKATNEVWWDEKRFWRKKKGVYTSMDAAELTNYFRVECGLSTKSLKGAVSPAERALNHIYSENFVVNAAPYIFQPPGLLLYQGKRRLNTYMHHLVNPEDGSHDWGSFPFVSQLLDRLFTPASQLPFFLAWYKHFYLSGLNLAPTPGQVIFLMGGAGIGKTLLNREIIGRSVGGYVDASSYLIRGAEFNHHLFDVPLWSIDDDTVSDSAQAQANVQSMLKKSVANSDHLVNRKFNNSGMTSWMGRIVCTTNLDFMSSRMLGPLDNSSRDKISVFRCSKESGFTFPSRPEIMRLLSDELPRFLSWLVKWVPPPEVGRDNRFGYVSCQESTLMEQSHQTSKVAPFKELLIEMLGNHFTLFPMEREWRGGVNKILQGIHMNPLNDCVIRSLRLEQVHRYLEIIEKEKVIKCRVETGGYNTRLWIFDRPPTASKPVENLPSASGVPNIFSRGEATV